MSVHRRRAAALIAAGLALGACSSTKITEAWRAPDAGPLTMKKVLAVAMFKNATSRRTAEDALRANIKRAEVVPSYTLQQFDPTDPDKVKVRVNQEGFDGVIAIRLVDSRQEVSSYATAAPAGYWGGWYGGGYGYGWGGGTEIRTDTIVRVEVNLYSLPDGKLLWAGVSETYNPSSGEQLVGEIVRAAAAKMKEQGLIS
jgi:hypothetical protein